MPGLDGAGDAAPDAAERQETAPESSGTGNDWDYKFGPLLVSIAAGTRVLYTGSTEHVNIQVTVTDAATGDPQDPTGLPVFVAYTTGEVPEEADWLEADWLSRTLDNTFWARLLTETDTLAIGALLGWVKIVDNSEIIIDRAGVLIIK